MFTENPGEINPDRPYCFRFTWIGPKYDNESTFLNATCDDVVGEKATVPCNLPLIVTRKSLVYFCALTICNNGFI